MDMIHQVNKDNAPKSLTEVEVAERFSVVREEVKAAKGERWDYEPSGDPTCNQLDIAVHLPSRPDSPSFSITVDCDTNELQRVQLDDWSMANNDLEPVTLEGDEVTNLFEEVLGGDWQAELRIGHCADVIKEYRQRVDLDQDT
jgi:hypothetical protein